MQPYSTQDTFLLFIPPAINAASFFFLVKLIAGGIFSGKEIPYIKLVL